MFNWLRKRKKSTPPPRKRRCALRLEELERRFCLDGSISMNPVVYEYSTMVYLSGKVTGVDDPEDYTVEVSGPVNFSVYVGADGTFGGNQYASGLGTVHVALYGGDDPSTASGGTDVTLSYPAPILSVTSGTWGLGQTMTVTGTVDTPDPQSTTIVLSGACDGGGGVDSQGGFTAAGVASSLGTVSVTAVDVWGQQSNSVVLPAIDPPSGLTMSVSYGSGTTVTLAGHVNDPDPSSCMIQFSGEVDGETSADAQGNYSLTTNATALGDVHAEVDDPWGQTCDGVSVTLTCTAPAVTGFTAVEVSDGTWTLQGAVSAGSGAADGSAANLTVTFAGMPSLDGDIATTDSSGNFSLTVSLSEDDYGSAQVYVTNAWGQNSSTVSTDVSKQI